MWLLLAQAARADDLTLLLHDPRGQGAPAATCVAPVCRSLLDLVDRAQSDIGFAFYGFRQQPELLRAMLRARDRGVRVHGVVDRDVFGQNYYSDTDHWIGAIGEVHDDWAADQATAEREPSYHGSSSRCPRPEGTRGPLQCLAFDLGDRCYFTAHASHDPIVFAGDIMHDKFVVVDHRFVWTGSTNASDSCAGGYNANLVFVVDSPRVASWYEAELARMYGGSFHGQKAPDGPRHVRLSEDVALDVLFSPQDDAIDRGVIPAIAQAQRRIDVAVFFLTHKGLAQALIDAHRRGVAVRVLLDASGAANEYSKHAVLRAAGIPVRIEDFGGKLHSKAVGIDGDIVIGGSMNWTNAGAEDNDENTLIVHAAAIRGVYDVWYDALWARVGPRWEAGQPDPEGIASGSACSDGVDNDYDGAVDREDPGCRGTLAVARDFPSWIVAKNGPRCEWTQLPRPTEGAGHD